MRRTFLTAEWRKLVIVNYSVDPAILTPYLPYKTELDFGKTNAMLASLGSGFINTKLRGLSIPFHRDFEEINLRFYVRYKDGADWKRGVTFIKEIVPNRALTFVANSLYNEKYVTLPTRSRWLKNDKLMEISYEWKHLGEWDLIEVAATPTLSIILPESEEEFITEHYWGYTQLSDRLTSEYQVEHPRWQSYSVLSHRIKVRFGELYGVEFGILKDMLPDSIMLAEGSDIAIRVADRIE